MSHNASPPRPGQIDTVSPLTIANAGTSTVTIAGKHFAPNAEPEVDAALGAVVPGSTVVTYPTSSTSQMVFDVVVTTPPAAPVPRSLAVSHGGVTGPASSISHGFEPHAMLSGNDGMFFVAHDSSTHYPTTGDLVDWSPAAGDPLGVLDCTLISGRHKHGFFSNGKAGFFADGSYNNKGMQAGTPTGTFAVGNGAPWTLGIVVEHTVATAAFNTITRMGPGGSAIVYFGGGTPGNQYQCVYSAEQDGTNYAQYTPANTIRTHCIPGIFSLIATQDGTASGLKFYVNGVDQGAQTGTLFGTLSTNFQVYMKYALNVIIGDMFIKEAALSLSDVTALNNYWTAKFDIP